MIIVDGTTFVFDASAGIAAFRQESFARAVLGSAKRLNVRWDRKGAQWFQGGPGQPLAAEQRLSDDGRPYILVRAMAEDEGTANPGGSP
jgi:hypothetical protein